MLWVLTALVAAGPISAALDGRSAPVMVLVTVACWLGWAVGLGALLVLRSSSLTVVRVLVPGGFAVALTATLVSGIDAAGIAAVAIAALATIWVLMPWVGEAFVDGSSYGNEHRLLLRPPVVFWLIAPITWALVAAGTVTGPLLMASRRWPLGVPVTIVGWAVAAHGVRSLHQLTRRWLVLVPTGLVVHDHLTMPESQLFPRIAIRSLGAAPVGSDAHDLTAGASGVALLLELTEPIELLVRTGWGRSRTTDVEAVLFSPTRPRRVLDAAAKRRIRVG